MGTSWCLDCAASVQPIAVGELAGIPLIAGGRLEGPLQRAIHTYKYGGRRGLAVPLARQVLKVASRPAVALRGLTFVPLHPSRQRERGFNQAERLALELAGGLGLPVVGGLVRQRATSPQVGLGQIARRENMMGVFAWTSSRPAPTGLGLVDDVCTTGATLEAAAAAVGAGGGGLAAFLVVAAAQTLAPAVVRTPGTVCLS
jgi:predicted amidophosphoribosyltransferase